MVVKTFILKMAQFQARIWPRLAYLFLSRSARTLSLAFPLKVVKAIKEAQPLLGITDVDILCVQAPPYSLNPEVDAAMLPEPVSV